MKMVCLIFILITCGFAEDSINFDTEIERAILSERPLDELRLVRNQIYALHGKEFKDSFLKEYFTRQKWYFANPGYSDDLLSKSEIDLAAKIQKIEKEIKSLSVDDSLTLAYYRELYLKYKDGHDSTRIIEDDITGEGYKEKMALKVYLLDGKPLLSIYISRGSDTLFADTNELCFDPATYVDKIHNTDFFSYIYKYFNLDIGFDVQYTVWPLEYQENNMDTEQLHCSPKAKIFHVAINESGSGCAKVWDYSVKKFIDIICQ